LLTRCEEKALKYIAVQLSDYEEDNSTVDQQQKSTAQDRPSLSHENLYNKLPTSLYELQGCKAYSKQDCPK